MVSQDYDKGPEGYRYTDEWMELDLLATSPAASPQDRADARDRANVLAENWIKAEHQRVREAAQRGFTGLLTSPNLPQPAAAPAGMPSAPSAHSRTEAPQQRSQGPDGVIRTGPGMDWSAYPEHQPGFLQTAGIRSTRPPQAIPPSAAQQRGPTRPQPRLNRTEPLDGLPPIPTGPSYGG